MIFKRSLFIPGCKDCIPDALSQKLLTCESSCLFNVGTKFFSIKNVKAPKIYENFKRNGSMSENQSAFTRTGLVRSFLLSHLHVCFYVCLCAHLRCNQYITGQAKQSWSIFTAITVGIAVCGCHLSDAVIGPYIEIAANMLRLTVVSNHEQPEQ